VVGYVMLDLKSRKPDVRAYVRDLEQWLIETLAEFNVKGERREGRVGIWVQRGPTSLLNAGKTRSRPWACASNAGSPCMAWH
jgi:lipoyl(octanoyl) transferase